MSSPSAASPVSKSPPAPPAKIVGVYNPKRCTFKVTVLCNFPPFFFPHFHFFPLILIFHFFPQRPFFEAVLKVKLS